jgi:hypothetical protein
MKTRRREPEKSAGSPRAGVNARDRRDLVKGSACATFIAVAPRGGRHRWGIVMKKLLCAVLAAALLAGCAGGGIGLPEGSGQVDIKHRIPSK